MPREYTTLRIGKKLAKKIRENIKGRNDHQRIKKIYSSDKGNGVFTLEEEERIKELIEEKLKEARGGY